MLHVIKNQDHLYFVTDYEMEDNDITALANNSLNTPFFNIERRVQYGIDVDPEGYFYTITPIPPKFVV